MSWLVIHNWARFQHYKDRDPNFVKDYIAENHDADYRALSGFLRGLLTGLRREFAASNGVLPWDPREVSRRLSLKVTERHLQALKDAGKIEEVASKPLALTRSRETEVQKEKQEEEQKNSAAHFKIPEPVSDLLQDIAPDDVATFAPKLNDNDKGTQRVLQKLRHGGVPYAVFASAYQGLEARRQKPPKLVSETRWYVATVQKLGEEYKRKGVL